MVFLAIMLAGMLGIQSLGAVAIGFRLRLCLLLLVLLLIRSCTQKVLVCVWLLKLATVRTDLDVRLQQYLAALYTKQYKISCCYDMQQDRFV
jgi:hypothetical protein